MLPVHDHLWGPPSCSCALRSSLERPRVARVRTAAACHLLQTLHAHCNLHPPCVAVLLSAFLTLLRTGMASEQEVAIKVLQDKRFKNRELQIMKMLDHTNVTTLLHYFYTEGEKPERPTSTLSWTLCRRLCTRCLGNTPKRRRPSPRSS